MVGKLDFTFQEFQHKDLSVETGKDGRFLAFFPLTSPLARNLQGKHSGCKTADGSILLVALLARWVGYTFSK